MIDLFSFRLLTQFNLFIKMKQILISLLVLCSLGLFEARGTRKSTSHGLRNVDISRLGIYDGKATSIQKHPYMVAISYGGIFLCTGTIISKKWVITSADCLYGTYTPELTVRAGSSNTSTGGVVHQVSQTVTHPSYDVMSTMDYDYALLQIQDKFKWSETTKAVKLPKKAAKNGATVVITGWGETGQNEDNSLLEGKLKVLSLNECKKVYEGFDITFTNRMICTYNKGKASPCNGDAGDPITKKNILHSFFLDIAVSGECSNNAYPAIGTNIFIVVPWIQNITGIQN